MYPQTRYRTFSTEEIRAFYAPRVVIGHDDVCIIDPFNRAEGPVPMIVPKLLPTNAAGKLVDLTEATVDQEHLICREMGLIRMETIYVQLGQLVHIHPALPYGLLLGRPHIADALRLEIHYSKVPAWGHHHDSLPADKFPGEVIIHKSEPLNGIHWIDFWLVRIDDGFPLFRKYYIRAFHHRLRRLNEIYF